MKKFFRFISMVIVLTPFLIGTALLMKIDSRAPGGGRFVADTRQDGSGMIYKGVDIDWTFCPEWRYKPLWAPARPYAVFMFRFRNESGWDIQLMPSYTFVSSRHRRYSANEEIAMYIEDEVEAGLGMDDETAITFEVPPGEAKYYLAVFERPALMKDIYLDVDLFRDVVLRIHYKYDHGRWINNRNEWVHNYKGRG